MIKIKVNLDRYAPASYDIYIGSGILDRVGLLIGNGSPASRYVIISDATVASLHGASFRNLLAGMGFDVHLLTFPPGEGSKKLATALDIISELLKLGADRGSMLIALGGGVTGDLVAFIASIYMRSVPYVHIPTTLMAQVDSSIGGKTGIDLPEGKNLLGTFYQPKAIFIDLELLSTLPDTEYRGGLAEVLKYGIIEDIGLLDLLEGRAADVMARNWSVLETIVAKSCTIKKGIVEIDELDTGVRRMLNFGHTIGHAIEADSGYTISHGNAVAMGMVAAARISEKGGHLLAKDRTRIEKLIETYGLPDHIPASLSTEGLIARMAMDKKKKGAVLSFVLLKKLGIPFIHSSVKERIIRETLEEMRQ